MANDYFQFQQFTIRQARCAMKVGTDGTLLGAWAYGGRRILDVGTGTGLIALMMAQRFPEALVTGIDINAEAVAQAQENEAASPFASHVKILLRDMAELEGEFDSIVSNPPYICRKEADEMEKNVLEYEPDTALFVPDDDPLLFYRHIMNYAHTALRSGGRLYFEINPLYADSIVEQLQQLGFTDIAKINDQFAKARFIKASKK